MEQYRWKAVARYKTRSTELFKTSPFSTSYPCLNCSTTTPPRPSPRSRHGLGDPPVTASVFIDSARESVTSGSLSLRYNGDSVQGLNPEGSSSLLDFKPVSKRLIGCSDSLHPVCRARSSTNLARGGFVPALKSRQVNRNWAASFPSPRTRSSFPFSAANGSCL